MPRHVLRRRVHLVKRRHLIQIRIQKRLQNRIQPALHLMKIAQQPIIINLGAHNRDSHTPVVTVRRLTHTTHHNGMGRTKLSLHT